MVNLSKQEHKISDVRKGELWMAHDSKSGKVRPFLILSEELSGVDVDVSIAPATTTTKRNEFDVELMFWKEAGLSVPSIVRCSKVHYIHHGFLRRKIGIVNPNDMKRIDDSLRKFFGL